MIMGNALHQHRKEMQELREIIQQNC